MKRIFLGLVAILFSLFSVSAQGTILFSTTKEIGESIEIRVNYENDAWIDLNNNGVRDENETLENGVFKKYTIMSQTLAIYGDIQILDFNDSTINYLSATEVQTLETIVCFNSQLLSIDINSLSNLSWIQIEGNKLNTLELNSLFDKLPETQMGYLAIVDNPGVSEIAVNRATVKGWIVDL